MSFSLHSSTENFGGGRRSSSSGSNSSSSWRVSVKSLIGRDVAEGLGEALVQEPLERRALDGDQIGQVEDLVEVRERITVPDGGGRQTRITPLWIEWGGSPWLGGADRPRTDSRQGAEQTTTATAQPRHARVEGQPTGMWAPEPRDQPLLPRSAPTPGPAPVGRKAPARLREPYARTAPRSRLSACCELDDGSPVFAELAEDGSRPARAQRSSSCVRGGRRGWPAPTAGGARQVAPRRCRGARGGRRAPRPSPARGGEERQEPLDVDARSPPARAAISPTRTAERYRLLSS